LTSRERNILQLVVEGRSSAQIADTLSFSPKTVDTYRSRIKQKLGIHDLPLWSSSRSSTVSTSIDSNP